MYVRDKTVWRIHQRLGIVEVGWYNHYEEEHFLTAKTFSTKEEGAVWLKEFWEAYWRLADANSPKRVGVKGG
jgi:hypothetical protein